MAETSWKNVLVSRASFCCFPQRLVLGLVSSWAIVIKGTLWYWFVSLLAMPGMELRASHHVRQEASTVPPHPSPCRLEVTPVLSRLLLMAQSVECREA